MERKEYGWLMSWLVYWLQQHEAHTIHAAMTPIQSCWLAAHTALPGSRRPTHRSTPPRFTPILTDWLTVCWTLQSMQLILLRAAWITTVVVIEVSLSSLLFFSLVLYFKRCFALCCDAVCIFDQAVIRWSEQTQDGGQLDYATTDSQVREIQWCFFTNFVLEATNKMSMCTIVCTIIHNVVCCDQHAKFYCIKVERLQIVGNRLPRRTWSLGSLEDSITALLVHSGMSSGNNKFAYRPIRLSFTCRCKHVGTWVEWSVWQNNAL